MLTASSAGARLRREGAGRESPNRQPEIEIQEAQRRSRSSGKDRSTCAVDSPSKCHAAITHIDVSCLLLAACDRVATELRRQAASPSTPPRRKKVEGVTDVRPRCPKRGRLRGSHAHVWPAVRRRRSRCNGYESASKDLRFGKHRYRRAGRATRHAVHQTRVDICPRLRSVKNDSSGCTSSRSSPTRDGADELRRCCTTACLETGGSGTSSDVDTCSPRRRHRLPMDKVNCIRSSGSARPARQM